MISASVRETNRSMLSFLKKAVNERPNLPSTSPMANLKRRRESPPSGSETIPITTSSTSSLISRPGYQQPILPGLQYQSHYSSLPTPTKRSRMSNMTEYAPTAAGGDYSYSPPSTGPYSATTVSMPAQYHQASVSMPPPTSYTTGGQDFPSATYTGGSVSPSPATTFYPLPNYHVNNAPSQPDIQIDHVDNVEEQRRRRRQERNREAQKKFRERQKMEQAELASENQELRRNLENANERLEQARLENAQLKRELQSMRSSESLAGRRP